MNTVTTAVTVYLVMSAVITTALCGLIHMSRRREANMAHRASERVVTRLRVASRPSEAREKAPLTCEGERGCALLLLRQV